MFGVLLVAECRQLRLELMGPQRGVQMSSATYPLMIHFDRVKRTSHANHDAAAALLPEDKNLHEFSLIFRRQRAPTENGWGAYLGLSGPSTREDYMDCWCILPPRG
jgi:hypothetical protein